MLHPVPSEGRLPAAARVPFPWPHLLSGLRLALAPLLVLLAWQGASSAAVAVLAVAFASDALDGLLARRLGLCSARGAVLDSRADLALWLALPPSVAWLRPDVVHAAAPEIGVLAASLLLPTAVGFARFRRLTSYHTWGAKLAGVVLAATLLAILAGASPSLLRVAAAVAALSQLEELAITALLPAWRPDVRSVLHARRLAEER